MSYEIDFLPVGNPGEDGKVTRSGDAIAFRYGNLTGPNPQQTVVVVDGGFTSSGEKLVEHIKKYYGTDKVDFVISTHPHDDHIQGLFVVLEKMKVGMLLMHLPWDHAEHVQELLDDDRTTHTGTKQRLKESFAAAHDLHALAVSKDIQVHEPFQGTRTKDGCIHVLGPSEVFYRRCIAADMADEPMEGVRSLGAALMELAKSVVSSVVETWDHERLTEPVGDSVEPLNHSSTIIHLNFAGSDKVVLTADAGVQALTEALDYAARVGIDVRQCRKVQVPHHGSKRNVGPSILNRLLGNPLASGAKGNKTGMLSCATDGEPKHPSRRVTNAFARRGALACATKGGTKCFRSEDMPVRPGWNPAESIQFTTNYSEDD